MSEKENLRLIEQLHVGESYSRNLLKSNLLTEDTEWWAGGPLDSLPWAGTCRGRERITRWFEVLNSTMEYDKFEPFESIAQGDNVVVLYHAEGRAKSTGRAFKSDIVRIYTFHEGKLTRVRNYDTAFYVSALRGLKKLTEDGFKSRRPHSKVLDWRESTKSRTALLVILLLHLPRIIWEAGATPNPLFLFVPINECGSECQTS